MQRKPQDPVIFLIANHKFFLLLTSLFVYLAKQLKTEQLQQQQQHQQIHQQHLQQEQQIITTEEINQINPENIVIKQEKNIDGTTPTSKYLCLYSILFHNFLS